MLDSYSALLDLGYQRPIKFLYKVLVFYIKNGINRILGINGQILLGHKDIILYLYVPLKLNFKIYSSTLRNASWIGLFGRPDLGSTMTTPLGF